MLKIICFMKYALTCMIYPVFKKKRNGLYFFFFIKNNNLIINILKYSVIIIYLISFLYFYSINK